MTPSGWTLDNIVLLGVGTMFGGLFVAALFGVLVGRWRGGATGIGAAMLLWGLGNLTVCAMTVSYVQFESAVLTLALQRCEVQPPDSKGRPRRLMVYALPPGAGASAPAGDALGGTLAAPTREVRTPVALGACPQAIQGSDPLRVARSDLHSTRNPVAGDWTEDDRAIAVAASWGVFGAFALLFATLLLGHELQALRGRRRGPLPPAPPAKPPARWRKTIGELLGTVGLLVFLAAFAVPWFMSGPTERGIQFGVRAVAMAMGIWIVAGMLVGTMTWPAGVFLAFFAVVMLVIGHTVWL